MNSKEEILDTENNKPDEMQTNWATVTRSSALSAMGIHSKKTAIAFADWIFKENYVNNGKNMWHMIGHASGVTKKSTETLYELFLQSLNNNTLP